MVKYGENEISRNAVEIKGPKMKADGKTPSTTKSGNPYEIADINVAIPDAPPEGTRWSGSMPVFDKATGEVFTGRIPAKSEQYTTKDGTTQWKTTYPKSDAVLKCADCPTAKIEDVLVTKSNENPDKAVFVPTTAGVKDTKEKFPISATKGGGPNESLSLAEIKETSALYTDGKFEREGQKRYAVGLPYGEMVKEENTKDGKRNYKFVTLELNGESVNFPVREGAVTGKDGVSKATNGIVMSNYTNGGKEAAEVTGYVNGKKEGKQEFSFKDVQDAFQAKQTEISKGRGEAEANSKQTRFDDMRAKATTSRVTDTPAPAAPTAPAAEKSEELDAPI